jgi:tetratricopeptide (TPR) repeat protein
MKVKVLMLALGCSMMSLGAYAQTGVQSGTKFGSGEDSIRCITNISLFVPYAKAGNFKDAYEFWHQAYTECPAAHKDIYLYGVRIMDWKINTESDPTKKMALIDELMGIYDTRVKYFGNDKKYGKDWIVSRKAADYIRMMGDKADPKVYYGWLGEVINEFGEKTEAMALSLYMMASHRQLLADPNFKSTYLEDYLKCSKYISAQLAAAQAAGNAKEEKNLTQYKSAIDGGFAGSGAADCETLQNMYADKVEAAKGNLDALKEIVSMLRKVRCQEIEAFYNAAAYAYELEPSADAAIGIAKQAVKAKDYDKAIKYFEEAANMETDAVSKAEDYYLIAVLLNEQGQKSKAREYCRKAVETNPDYGHPYILIGNMYAQTARTIYPSDPVLMKTVYFAAILQFEKARQVDQNVAEEASKMIAGYRAHLPSTEEVFMHPELEKGKPFRVGGWIGETVTIR